MNNNRKFAAAFTLKSLASCFRSKETTCLSNSKNLQTPFSVVLKLTAYVWKTLNQRVNIVLRAEREQKGEKKKMEMSKFKLAFAVLLVCLCVSVCFNVVQYLGTEHSPKTFVFTWVWDEKEYRMELAFETVPTLTGANLSITAKINEERYYYRDNLNLFFDLDGDGEFKKLNPGFEFLADNGTYSVFLIEGWVTAGPYYEHPQPSPYHTCTFDSSGGYTFKINFPLEELNLKNDLIYIAYGEFWASFHFDPEGELFK